MPIRRRSGFTLTDVVLCVAALALLAAMAAPALDMARSVSFRLRCGSNLRVLGESLLLYATANRGQYPRTTHVPGAPPTQFTGSAAADPFALGGPAPNDVTAALFLLVRTQELDPSILVCPTTSALIPWDFGGKPATAVSNFPSGLHLGYSVANPYPDAAAARLGYRWDTTLGAEIAVMGDTNPGGSDLPRLVVSSPEQEMRKGNTLNEKRRGAQLVLFGDLHVEAVQNPFCGTQRDNIYRVAGATDGSVPTSAVIVGSPAWAGDSVLLPVATVDPKGLESPEDHDRRRAAERREALILACIKWGLLGAVVVTLFTWFRRHLSHLSRLGRRGGFPPPS
jgi:hypothetical protein